jgi:hypothetical protein
VAKVSGVGSKDFGDWETKLERGAMNELGPEGIERK